MPPHAATPKAGNKRRAPMSCDRCKSRKTKCVDPVPGPCQFCASIGAACHLDPSRRRQRPYYHVSEEEFRYMTKALEHFLPNIELNLQNLRDVVQSFEQSGTSSTSIPDLPPPYSAPSDSSSSSSESIVVVSERGVTPVSSSSSTVSDHTPKNDVTIEEIDELHGELGWLRVDSKGNYRHVGANSGYGFHAAVRSLRNRRGSTVDPALQQVGQTQGDIVAPCTAAPQLPLPSTPDSSSAVSAAVATGGVPSPRLGPQSLSISNRRLQIFLPRRDLCNRCVSRYFRDIQSIYWFWSAERFYAVLDRLYAGDPSSATPAVLCSLYSILALTCESEAAQQMSQLNQMDLLMTEPPPAAKYLSLAKALVPALCDEADADSVRGLSLLGLALQSSMYNNTAYIYIGAAARIALTLGLHLQRSGTIEPLKGCLQRQIDLRLYSTLYLLDLDIALCYGNPPALTTDEHTTSKPLDLSEQILSPGSHMPLDYLTVSCQVVQIKRQLSKLLYARTRLSSSSPRLSISAVSDSLQSLRTWYANIPPHLRDVSRAAPFHQRSVSVLHLRYWSVTVFATRPFLLYSALHADAFAALPAAKRASFEEFCRTCIDAAKQSLAVIGIMRDAGLQSSLVTLDTGCIIEDLQVLLLALLPSPWRSTSANSASDGDDVRTCLRTLQGMEQILWTNHALTEVMAQLDENGLLNDDNTFSPQSGTDTPGNFFLDIHQQAQAQSQQNEQNQQAQLQLQNQQQMISGVMEAYFSDLSDPFFDIDDGTAAPMLSDHYDAMPGLSI
ncbi:aldehyde dehydrogenase [Ophiostoma piceae UAMH 11346]|uniref:Aldehyde dehydrogenase n=1 Tax=Ophiostoma piceae (strain UAMH 11346) TaxID=1262450 RepID=S3CPB0_OPHP1|nr:aldehyde dehydrogenase [Ophiostoma piceae UAMH 11346]